MSQEVSIPATANATGGLIVVTPNVQKVATGYTGRRVIVDDKRCNSCHQELGAFTEEAFHGGQRNNGTTCSWCHTQNRTSSGWSADSTSLVHAIHAAMGSQISCNEEWYYTPIDAVYKMPWHVLIKWRVNVTAGFEGGTSIYINPMTPIELRDKMVPRLYKLRDEGKIGWMRIAEECRVDPNPLKYYLK